MNLLDILGRTMAPEPWTEGDNIPWNDPDFSRRMLKEHLSQEHDAASRRATVVDQHVAWIHDTLLYGKPGRVLDLGCGPGLYTTRLARLGHESMGIDFSPASVAHANEVARAEDLRATHVLGDLRSTPFGTGFDLIMMIYGEFNVFAPSHRAGILDKACQALRPAGTLLLEISTFEEVRRMGTTTPTWWSSKGGLFSDQPHLVLEESFWAEQTHTATNRYYVVDAKTGQAQRWAASYQAYTEGDLQTALRTAGFDHVSMHSDDGKFFWVTCKRQESR